MSSAENLRGIADNIERACQSCAAIPVNDRKAQAMRRQIPQELIGVHPIGRSEGILNTADIVRNIIQACNDCNRAGRKDMVLAVGGTNPIRNLAKQIESKHNAQN